MADIAERFLLRPPWHGFLTAVTGVATSYGGLLLGEPSGRYSTGPVWFMRVTVVTSTECPRSLDTAFLNVKRARDRYRHERVLSTPAGWGPSPLTLNAAMSGLAGGHAGVFLSTHLFLTPPPGETLCTTLQPSASKD
jgi:hypothetical protein